jgi:hypothetical protein
VVRSWVQLWFFVWVTGGRVGEVAQEVDDFVCPAEESHRVRREAGPAALWWTLEGSSSANILVMNAKKSFTTAMVSLRENPIWGVEDNLVMSFGRQGR